MNLRVALLPTDLTWQPAGVAVVIDVLRATTVITQAIAAGAAEVVVCGEIDQAFALADSGSPRPLLCGERACQRIAGFDLGNSPAEYTPARIAGKPLVMTTTNGTRAVLAAGGFARIYAGSFNNLSAIVAQLVPQPQVSLLCAGTDGVKTDEDLLLAGAILHELLPASAAAALRRGEAEAEAIWLWRDQLASGRSLAERLRQTLGGRNLLSAGYADDIDACAMLDSTDAVAAIDGADRVTFRQWPR